MRDDGERKPKEPSPPPFILWYSSYEANIAKYYLFSFLYYFFLWLPTWVLFLLDKGFSLTQITLLDVFFFTTIVILGIPVGILSDRIGRKKTLSLGSILTSVGLFLFAESDSFAAVAFSYVFWAGALTFITAGSTAFLYDTLKMIGRESEFKKINGRSIFFATGSLAIASYFGGGIGEYSLKLPITITSAICLTSFLVTFTFKEPTVKSQDRNYASHFNESVGLIKRNPRLKFLMIFGIFMTVFLSIGQIFTQPYLRLLGIDVRSMGGIYTVFKLAVAASASLAHLVEERMGESRTLVFLPSFMLACLLLLSGKFLVIPALFLANVLQGFMQPILNDYINRHIPTKNRATVLSLQNVFYSVVILFFEPAMGYVADRFSLMASFYLTASCCLFLLVYVFFKRKMFES